MTREKQIKKPSKFIKGTHNSSPAREHVPCLNCGGLIVAPDVKEDKNDSRNQQKSSNEGSNSNMSEKFITGLIQQINLLELEITHLKDNKCTKQERNEQPEDPMDTSLEELQTCKTQLRQKSDRLTVVEDENKKLQKKIAILNEDENVGKKNLIESVSKLTGKLEQADWKVKQCEKLSEEKDKEREKLTILLKDKDKRIGGLEEEIGTNNFRLDSLTAETKNLQRELLSARTEAKKLQDKFAQSTIHVLEESQRALRNENLDLQHQVTKMKVAEEERKESHLKLQTNFENLISDNSKLSTNLSEAKKKLECEVRLREGREAQVVVNSQEAVVAREKEKVLNMEIEKIKSELEREKQKLKTANEKISRESQHSTSLELRISTLNSRVAELQSQISNLQESNDKIREEYFVLKDNHEKLHHDYENQCMEMRELNVKLNSTENRLIDSERRVETLATLQSQKWMEFAKMADSMKEMSNNMLLHSRTNTRKSVIRADLNEEFET